MAIADKQRWDEKHAQDTMPHAPIKFITQYAHLAKGKQALDIACGNGRHSKYLASIGFKVDALDISSVAIEQLKGEPNIEAIEAIEVDFDSYALEKNKYDLIVCTYFLERKLFPQMLEALKPEGIILMETFVAHEDNVRKASNPTFRLKVGELEAYFAKSCELRHMKEWWDVDYQGFKSLKATMVARKL